MFIENIYIFILTIFLNFKSEIQYYYLKLIIVVDMNVYYNGIVNTVTDKIRVICCKNRKIKHDFQWVWFIF